MSHPTRAAGRLAIVGTYPPPRGGVSTHTERLCSLLRRAGVDYRVYNLTSAAEDGERVFSVAARRRTWMVRFLFFAEEDTIYIMSRRLAAWIVGALLARLRGKRVLVRLQNAALLDRDGAHPLRRRLAGWALGELAGVVCVNQKLSEATRRLGVAADRVHHFPGFLPPSAGDHDRERVHPAVWEFRKGKAPFLCAAGKIVTYGGEDLYGLDLLVDLIGRLKPDFPSIGLVVCFWDFAASEQEELDRLVQRAERLGVASSILFNTHSGILVPVLEASDLFLRPTNTDGDANSIREALVCGIGVVASDAADRPPDTILFPSRDLDGLEAATREGLARAKPPARNSSELKSEAEQRAARYVALLESTLAGSG